MSIAHLARDKKAENVVVLDMRKVCTFCDFFVILSGESHRQVNAFREIIEEALASDGIKSFSKVAANDESGWLVLDYGSIVVHIFHKPMRDFYALEQLWSDALKVRITTRKRKSPVTPDHSA